MSVSLTKKEKISERVLYYLEVQTDYLHLDTPVFSVQFIKRTNFITHRINIKIILVIIEKQVVPQF